MSIEISKRTRSQLVVPDHVLRLPLTRSPLKHARVTSKNRMQMESNDQMMDEEEMEVQDEEDEHMDDEILLSPKKNKRSSNTCLEDALSPTSYREPKRAKLDPLPALSFLGMGNSVENQNLTLQSNRKSAKSFVRAATESACQKLTPPSAIMNGKATPASVFRQRARSVPLPAEPFPELDLRTLSPMRSPSKIFISQLKITPVPEYTEATPTSPLPPSAGIHEDAPAAKDEMDVDAASTMSLFTNIPTIEPKLPDLSHPTVNIELPTPRKNGCPPQAPLSPLTPLTPTSLLGRLPAMGSVLAAATEKRSNQPQDAATFSLLAAHGGESSISSAAVSRLPRPSTSASSLMPPPPVPVKRGRSATIASSHSKPIPNLSKGKKVMPQLSGPRRMTRSVSMKERKPEGLDESNELPEATSRPSAGNNLLSSSKELETSSQASIFKVPALNKSSLKCHPDAATLRQTSLASFMKAKPVPSSSMTDSSSSSSSTPAFAQRQPPTPSKIPLPVSPSKQRTGTAAIKPIFGRSNIIGPSKHTSSLSTLSTALEKLAMPPPSRPNTSLGFNVNSEKDEHTRAGPSVTKDDSAVAGLSGTFSRPTASSLKRHATVTGSTQFNVVRKMKDRSGTLRRTATGIFGPGLAGPSTKASRKTSLPSVMASPVKGSSSGAFDDNPNTMASLWDTEENTALEQQSDVAAPPVPSNSNTSEAQVEDAAFLIEELASSVNKGKKREGWDSHRASSALHSLSQSLSVLPETPLKLVAVGTRTGLRSSSSTYHAASGSGAKFAADVKDKGNVQEGTDGAAPQRSVPSKSDTAASPMEGGSAGKKGALKVLKKCAIFVDVRTDDGDDAGSLFVDMLRSLGARILGRVGQSCTHIIYKNGSANTLTRYRLMNDPKPVVVGIAWVVECVEQRSRVDEAKFKVDLELVNVAGTNKRRRSMLPKHMSPLSNAPGTCYIPANLSSDDSGKRHPPDGDGSPAQDTDTSFRSAKDDDDLPPLERARRRRSILPGGQTRLV